MFNVEKFIDLVRERQLLWDKRSREYSDRTNRDLAWIEVGEVMYNNWAHLSSVDREEKVKLLKSKWRHLRDNYLRSLKVDNSKRRQYLYAENMAFLHHPFEDNVTFPENYEGLGSKRKIEDEGKSTIKVLKDLGSKIRKDNYEAHENYSSDTIEDTYTVKNAHPSLSPTKTFQTTKLPILRPKLPILRPKPPPFDPKLPTAIQVQVNSKQGEDADTMFFNSLLPDYKELDEEEKLDFRIKCLQFIRDARKSRKSQNFT